MPRAKGGTKTRARHKKRLKLDKGYYGAKSRLFSTATDAVDRARQSASRDLRNLKRDFRRPSIPLESAATPPTVPSEQTIASPRARGTGKAPSLMGCRMRPYREDPMRAPFLLIEEGPIAGSDPDRSLTPAETKCVENLRKAGKKAIERGKITESIFHYLSAMDTAPGLAGPIYLDLASALDQTAYTQPAVIAYRKAWAAFEAVYNRPGMQVEGR